MRRFAALVDLLETQPREEGRVRLLTQYLRDAPDPDRGQALALLTGALELPRLSPAKLRALALARTDEMLFALSHDYVGDLGETVALIWPEPTGGGAPRLGELLARLTSCGRGDLPDTIAAELGRLPVGARRVLLKLVSGRARPRISGASVRCAIAGLGQCAPGEIAELWHGQTPPYTALLSWAEGRGPRPAGPSGAALRPFMPVRPFDPGDLATVSAEAHLVEWAWDGVRAQLAAEGGRTALYDAGGDDISAAFPELTEGAGFNAVLDGELMAGRPDRPASRGILQRRLGRASASVTLRRAVPVHLRVFDILSDDGEDLRGLPLQARRARLERWFARTTPRGLVLPEIVEFADWPELDSLRRRPPEGAEGVVVKRRDGVYDAEPSAGGWRKWKREPVRLNSVLLYARRGASGTTGDLTVGLWRDSELVSVGRVEANHDAQLAQDIDAWVRTHTTVRYGPVREVEPTLVLEIVFEAVQRSRRHKSGFVLRRPRVVGIRQDLSPNDADRLSMLEARA